MGRHSRKRNAPPRATPGAEAETAGTRPGPGRLPSAPGAQAGPGTQAGPGAQAGPGTQPGPGSPGGPGGPYRQAERGRPPAVPRPYPGPPGSVGPPGSGGPAAPGHGTPFPRQGTPPDGVPEARGGHPEQREPGGGWGAARGEGTGGVPGQGSSPGPRPPAAGAGRRAPHGPRQEYLDAFDDDVFAGAPARTSPSPGVPRSRSSSDPAAGASPSRAAAGGQTPPGSDEEPGLDGESGAVAQPAGPAGYRRGRARAKGRTFTGVAAAAVTTVLAVVVAGQVTGIEQGRENRAASAGAGAVRGDDASSRTGGSPGPSPSAAARPATYGERLARVRPLDPDLDGPGDFTTFGGDREGAGRGEVVRYRVEVEKGLPLDGELFQEAVHRTLNDDRSWAHDGARSFARVAEAGEADFVITLASPGTTGEWCAKSGLDTTVRNVSCDSASTARVMINAWRWAQGSKTFGDARIREYREMLINHEVGHRLGLGHRYCASDGALAPVMMQQTKTLTTGERTCRPNAWPHPGSAD